MRIAVPENVKFVIDTLCGAGFEAYIVGGCVRDCLLGLTAGDYDVCTSARPDDVIRLFRKTAATGVKHGTVTVIENDTPIEVTTFRTDGDYSDSRKPDTVEFINDLKADLSRRDFTVNAMCFSESSGLIDYFDGLGDLKKKTLRTVGDAEVRFSEDALRILRLFRFCSTLDFKPEKQTFDAALRNAHLLKKISAERIEKELRKTACGKNPAAVIPLIEAKVLPTLKPNGDISKIPLLPQKENLRFFAFLYLQSDNLPALLNFLKCSNAFKKYASDLSGGIGVEIESRRDIKRLLALLEENIFDLFALKTALFGENTEKQVAEAKEVLRNGEPYKISQLAINGKDAAAAGYKGSEINRVLSGLLEEVITKPELNKKEILENLLYK